MVRKKLAVAVATIGALQANLVSALGLGDFSLHSALNQPLNAEIKLLNTRDLDESQVKITLAGKDDFDRAGVSRDYFLTNLKFRVELDSNGNGVIRVTTHDPVVEPYLNFLVEARWPTGRMLREYTVLLDPPVFSESQAAPVKKAAATSMSQPKVQAPAQEKPSASVPAITRGSSDRQTLTQGALQAGEKYRVKQDETLWEIAAKSRPSKRVSVQQTMVTIQRLNGNAFIGGNINRLKAGYVLRLPTEAEIADISGQEAVREVAQQNRAWKTGGSTASRDDGAQLDATSTAADSETGVSDGARLSIATSGDSDSAQGGDGRGEGAAALRNQLDASMESLDKTKRENTELQSRLNDMEAKIATLQRLLELKDDQLAALQGEMAEQQDVAAQPMAPKDAMTSEQMPDEGVAAETPAADMAGDASTDSETNKPQESKPVTTPPVAAPTAVAEQSVLDQLLSNPLYAGGAGLIVVALAALLIARRRKAAEAEDNEPSGAIFDETPDEALEGIGLEDDDDLSLGDLAEEAPDNADLLAAELEDEIAADNAVEKTASTAVKSETGDALAEADIYIAYGRYQQAIDLLTTAVAQEPERTDLQVKLLEVYLETRDKPAFQHQYLSLQALGDQDAVSDIKEMLSSVDGVADWLDNLPGSGAGITDADMDADLVEDSDTAEFNLDDDLDIDLDLDNLGVTQETEAVSLDEDFSLDEDVALDATGGELDLDLDLDDNEEEDFAAEGDGITRMLDAVEEPELEQADEIGAFSLDDDLELDLNEDALDLGEIEEAVESVGVEQAEEPEQVVADTDTATDVDMDLDLGSDEDLDLELGDLDELGGADLSELEAEFGGEEEPATSLDVNLDAADELADLELGDLDLSEGETVTLDTATTDDLQNLESDDLDFSEDLGSLSGGSVSAGADDLSLDMDDLDLSTDFDSDLQDLSAPAGGELSLETNEPEVSGAELGFEMESPLDSGAPANESFETSVAAATPAGDDEFDFLADTDEVATKLDLARAYIDMGDTEGAKDILDEVMQEGNDEQKQEAQNLLERV